MQLEELVHQGILVQIDGAALVEPRRSATQRFAARLCQDGIAHVIASDGHRAASWRPVTVLRDAVEAASALVGPARARWMACEAPAAILAGVALPEPPPVAGGGARTLRGLFKRR
jgi:tyrosine-protein phosphatase YwqE